MSLFHRTATAAAAAHAALRGSQLVAAARELSGNARRSPEALGAYADERLRETVDYAYAAVPYYRRIMDTRGISPGDIRTASDLERLPILTREAVRQHFDELQARPLPPKSRIKTTSGSTGEPLRFISTQAMHDWHDAAKLRAWRWAGYELGTPVALLWGSALDVQRFRSWSGRLRRLVNREHLFNAHDLSDATCQAFAHRMAGSGIEGIHGYPNAVHRLARQVLETGIDLPLRFVLTTAETLLPARRALIETAFGCPVFDYYGSRETSMVSQECAAHEGYHVSVDNGVIEIVHDGRAVAPGEMGEVLVTDFRNRAMPLIRYAIGDVARRATEPCPCGLPFPVFRAVEGRVSDMFRLRDGQVRTPLLLTSLIYPDAASWGYPTDEVMNIVQWQMIQEDHETFTIRLVLETPAPPDTYAYLEANFRRFVTPRARVRIELVDRIPTSGDGKRRPIISLVEEKDGATGLAGARAEDVDADAPRTGSTRP